MLLKNDEWITDEDIADPNPLPAILDTISLYVQYQLSQQLRVVSFCLTQSKSDMAYLTTVGRVLKVGDLAYKDEKFANGPGGKEGDFVLWKTYRKQISFTRA